MWVLFCVENSSIHGLPEKTGMTLMEAGNKYDAIDLDAGLHIICRQSTRRRNVQLCVQ